MLSSSSHIRRRSRVAAVAASAGLVLGCAQSAKPTAAPTPLAIPTASPAGLVHSVANLATPADARTAAVVESRTASLALDRIDQRLLPLDRTYKRNGTGRGVTVYVFDGGVLADHPELAGRVRAGYTAFPNDPKICNAHGTAVAGAIAGATLGVAPEAEIVDVKMVECSRLRGTIQGIVDGARWAVEDHRHRGGGPAIANWSFIADTASQIPALDSAVTLLRANGIPVVVSAGNLEINACRVSPGNAQGTIVVGSSSVMRDPTDPERLLDRRSPGTAYGPCVDVYAPGDSVLLPSMDGTQRATTQLWNGTSMSAGYVSGAVALYLQSRPTASPDEVSAWLRTTATRDVVENARAASTWLLYVGPRETQTSVMRVGQR